MKKDDTKSMSFLNLIAQSWLEDFWLKILTVVSVGLIIASFIVPPTGVIDPSVLAAVGEIAGLMAIIEFDKAIDKNLKTKLRIHNAELHIGDEHSFDDLNQSKTEEINHIEEYDA